MYDHEFYGGMLGFKLQALKGHHLCQNGCGMESEKQYHCKQSYEGFGSSLVGCQQGFTK